MFPFYNESHFSIDNWKIVTRSRDFFRSSSGRKIHGNIFSFLYFFFFENLNWNSAHVKLDKQKFPLLAHICVSLFMGKLLWGDTTGFRIIMFSFKRFRGNFLEIIFRINANWQRMSTSPEEWKFHSLIMTAFPSKLLP